MTFKDEPSSEFPHAYVLSLGSYKGSPFVTGHADSTNGVKTEILDYLSGQWQRAASYPFSNENRYLSKKEINTSWNWNWKTFQFQFRPVRFSISGSVYKSLEELELIEFLEFLITQRHQPQKVCLSLVVTRV